MIRIEKRKKKMITVKKILLLLSVIIFTSTSYNAANAARDCSDPKGFHAKMACKIQGKSFKKESSSIDSSSTSTIEKKRGPISSFFKKIRDFGGENIGEEG